MVTNKYQNQKADPVRATSSQSETNTRCLRHARNTRASNRFVMVWRTTPSLLEVKSVLGTNSLLQARAPLPHLRCLLLELITLIVWTLDPLLQCKCVQHRRLV